MIETDVEVTLLVLDGRGLLTDDGESSDCASVVEAAAETAKSAMRDDRMERMMDVCW